MTEAILSPGWATYLRVSDEDKQSPERSFAMQRQRIQEQLLAPSRVPFKQEYHDKLTGTNPNRIDYQQMLADAENGHFSHLGLYRADRFGRNAAEGLQAATKLISLGVRLRVANMPSLTPETPDGFFMFLLQMGLAQREVDVLRQRTGDGMEAKLRAGGWAHKAPEGYVNRERIIKKGKYERWVEPDPDHIQGIRDAWDLLLTDRYTLAQICEELAVRGHVRKSGKPWTWTDPKTGLRRQAKNQLQRTFHNPFYAGWVTSKRFGIAMGEVRGNWEPVITVKEFERGVQILRKRDGEKCRQRRRFYLLRNLLWVEVGGKRYKMFGSTPRPRSHQIYPYYITHAKPGGKSLHIPCDVVDDQISGWLAGLGIDPELFPRIREVYQSEIDRVTASDCKTKMDQLRQRISQLRNEEMRLARMHITGNISEDAYEQLRMEWQERVRIAETQAADLEQDHDLYLENLETALILLSGAHRIYAGLEEKGRTGARHFLASLPR